MIKKSYSHIKMGSIKKATFSKSRKHSKYKN